MWHAGVVDPVWTALALALTGAGGFWTVYAFRNRGVAAALRGAGLTLLPLAALMTGTLELVVDLGVDIGDWAVGLVFSPLVWIGIVLAGTSVVLWGSGTVLQRRAGAAEPKQVKSTVAKPLPQAKRPAADNDLADIEDILKRHGIS